MKQQQIRSLIIWAVLLFLVAWSLIQLFQLNSEDETGDPVQLLYKVSAFQFELLGNALQEAASAAATDDLNVLRQTLYTANYTHEHLVMAVGAKQLTPLNSMTDLMQYILRLQIGGNRQLKAEETDVLARTNETFQQLFAAYDTLFSDSGKPISSKNEQLKQLDSEISDQLEQIRFE